MSYKADITKSNILIAKFMLSQEPTSNVSVCARDKDGFDISIDQRTAYYTYNELIFYSSWNWLMSVYTVIENLDRDANTTEEYYSFLDAIHDSLIAARMDSVYWGIVDFIEYYNKQSKL